MSSTASATPSGALAVISRSRARLRHRLVMVAVHNSLRPTVQSMEAACFVQSNSVCLDRFGRPGPVVENRSWNIGRDVLDERSSPKDVEALRSIADGEHGDDPLFCNIEEQRVSAVPFGEHPAQTCMTFATVTIRIDVGRTSRQEYSVQPVRVITDYFPLARHRNQDRDSTSPLDRIGLIAVQSEALFFGVVAGRYPNPGSAHRSYGLLLSVPPAEMVSHSAAISLAVMFLDGMTASMVMLASPIITRRDPMAIRFGRHG